MEVQGIFIYIYGMILYIIQFILINYIYIIDIFQDKLDVDNDSNLIPAKFDLVPCVSQVSHSSWAF